MKMRTMYIIESRYKGQPQSTWAREDAYDGKAFAKEVKQELKDHPSNSNRIFRMRTAKEMI